MTMQSSQYYICKQELTLNKRLSLFLQKTLENKETYPEIEIKHKMSSLLLGKYLRKCHSDYLLMI